MGAGAIRVKVKHLIIAFSLVSSIATADQNFPNAASDLSVVTNRLYANYLAEALDGSEFYSNQSADGSWPDIDYADQSANWKPIEHLMRLKAMASSFQRANSPMRKDPALLAGIERGLIYWYERKPSASNWWYNDIGQQLQLQRILILMRNELTGATLLTGTSYFIAPSSLPKLPNGQNLVWYADEQMVRGLLLNAAEDVTAATSHIRDVLSVRDTLSRPMTPAKPQWTAGPGIQTDFGFHMHGPLLYNGGYGLRTLQTGVSYAHLLRGTGFAFAESVIKTLSDYVLHGSGRMIRGNFFDFAARGREISRRMVENIPLAIGQAASNLAAIAPKQAAALRALALHTRGQGKPASFIGHKHFWNSDFAVHQTDAFYSSVKMVSARTKGTEMLGGENLKGYWLPYGMNIFVRDGKEYDQLPPVWDWTHLPGVTSPETLPSIGSMTQKEWFVGGVNDGQFGAATMKITTPPTEGSSLRASKSWFFFEKEVVALGAGISATDEAAINTTLNQTLLRGPIQSSGGPIGHGFSQLDTVRWIHHDELAYVFPQSAQVTVKSGELVGSWKSINNQESAEEIRRPVFSLWLSHGQRPSGASYQYIVVPGVSAAAADEYSQRIPVEILANTVDLQAVRHVPSDTTEAVFAAAGNLQIGNLRISLNAPALAVIRGLGDDAYEVTVSSPVSTKVDVRLVRGKKKLLVKYTLPQGARAGASYAKKLILK